MRPRLIVTTLIVGTLALVASRASTGATAFGPENPISVETTVADANGSPRNLLALFRSQPGNVNLLFLFGGGDMGKSLPGRLWCQDSFEDAHILRTLHEKYRDKGVGFVAVAMAPAYHSKFLGAKDRVFLDAAEGSEDFESARQAFVESTLAAQQAGTLPFAPQFDFRYALMLAGGEKPQPGPGWGPREAWHGGFRAVDETQYYGVPQFWLVDDEGRVLAPPFRGNVYHPHGGEIHIAYTLRDVDAAVNDLLSSGSKRKHEERAAGKP